MARILLTIEYDGGGYVGWQDQAGLPSIAGALCIALTKVVGEPHGGHQLQVAGRTDAGVHARGQRACFDTAVVREARRFAPALNHVLPANIRVHRAEQVANDFDVRRAARAKWYRYAMLSAGQRSALYAGRAWQLLQRADLTRSHAAAAALVGEQDFNAFRSVHCDAPHAIRSLYVVRLTPTPVPPIGTLWHLDLVGNAFCRHMCRIIAGTLADVASGDRPPDAVLRALASRRRVDAGQTAPPGGLTLMDIAYRQGPHEHAWPLGWPER